MLRAFVLHHHRHARWYVRDANGAVRGVDVLPPSAGGTIGVGTNIGRVDLNLNIVVDLRRYEYGDEGGVVMLWAPPFLVEGCWPTVLLPKAIIFSPSAFTSNSRKSFEVFGVPFNAFSAFA